jgi:hypothetical protein
MLTSKGDISPGSQVQLHWIQGLAYRLIRPGGSDGALLTA